MNIKNFPEPRLRVFINFLCELALLGKCTDKKNAAILCDEHMSQIYSIGLNGGPKHGVNCLCSLGLKYTCIHAEAQALMKELGYNENNRLKMKLAHYASYTTYATIVQDLLKEIYSAA